MTQDATVAHAPSIDSTNTKPATAMSYHTAPYQNRVTTLDEVLTEARILVVDDDDVMRGLHENVLNLAGYATGAAADGEEALEMLATGDFDLVLTDCQMPRLDGIGLVRTLRAAGNRIPVMMVSGSLADEHYLAADVRGEIAVDLVKPVRTRSLLAGIVRALHSRRDTPGGACIVGVPSIAVPEPRPPQMANLVAA